MTDFINLDEQAAPEVTVVARDVTKSSTVTSGPAFITWLLQVTREGGFTGKASYRSNGQIVPAEDLKTQDFAGQTLTAESYNSAA